MTNSKLFLSLLLAGAVGTASAQSLKDAKAAMEVEQYGKAKTMLQQLVTKKAKDGENYFYLGQIHLINEKVDSAAVVFQQGLTADPKEKLNNVGLGTVDLEKGNVAAAEQKFAEASNNIGKKEYLNLYYIGRAYIDAPKPDYKKAIEYLTRAKEMNAKDPLISVALGDAYAGLRENSPAYVAYRDALAINDKLLAPKIGQAIISRRAQAYDQVLEDLNLLTTEHPDYGPIYREIAETYYQSSRKAPDEQYREINLKALEAYKKYLTLTGDNSVDAKLRYADFLVFSGNYDELKTVSQELAVIPDVDPKVFRYLGYLAFTQDKDYAKANENMSQLMSKVDTSRLIGRDFLIAGMSAVLAGDKAKGLEYLNTAISKEGEDDDFDAEIAETAFLKYQEGEIEAAKELFKIPAANPKSAFYADANYYLGQAAYGVGSKLVAAPEGVELTPEQAAAKYNEAKPHLEEAVRALGIAAQATEQRAKDMYLIPSLYYKGLSEMALDNMLGNPEAAKGIFVDSFTKLLDAIKASTKEDPNNNVYAADAHTYLGYYAYIKGDNAKAKEHFNQTIALRPEDAFAKQMLESL